MQPQSSIFPLQPVQFSTGEELVLRGGRELFPLLPQAFEGINQIGFIGWGSQAPAQSQNLRDSLATVGSDILVKVGLRLDSKSVASAHAAGFTVDGSTLGEMFEVANTSDFLIVLISDGAMTKLWKPITEAMKPGATLGEGKGGRWHQFIGRGGAGCGWSGDGLRACVGRRHWFSGNLLHHHEERGHFGPHRRTGDAAWRLVGAFGSSLCPLPVSRNETRSGISQFREGAH